MSAKKASIQQATEFTEKNLQVAAKSVSAQKLSRMTLPEIEAVVQLVSKMVPAGNVPGMILSGLARLPGRRIPVQKLQQDVTALFSGVEQILDKAVYGAFFAGPAAILWGYQNLLKLAGKDPESAFPEGAWQFYADYALREDTARHTNETDGFDTILRENHIHLNKADRLTAWFMAAVTCLYQYPALLENEWRERVSISLLETTLRAASLETQKAKKILREWELARPYRRTAEDAQYDYPSYRRKRFGEFIQGRMQTVPQNLYLDWEARFNTALAQDLAAYQRQMSIVAYLEPGPYGETRVPFDLADAKIGIIHHDGYYLLPVCEEGSTNPMDVLSVRSQITALLESTPTPSQISSLAKLQRSAFANLRSKLNPVLVNELDNLKFAPILLSTDIRSRELPLSELRQTERGVGSHAMTIFDTGESIVFDQSHIFFDGAWGTALAEIMTNEALSWAHYLSLLDPPEPAETRLYTSLTLQLEPADLELVQQAPHVSQEASAETDAVDLRACLALRKHFKQRNDRIDLTINDILVLYRAIHAATYMPSAKVLEEIQKLSGTKPDVAANLRQVVEEGSRTNPAIIVPMDASLKSPRERVFPMNIEVPLTDLELLPMHKQTLKLLDAYESTSGNERAFFHENFNQMQKNYLATLAGLGDYFSRTKEIAAQGQSYASGAIKLLAHLPTPVQRLLDKIPEKFEVLNNIIKGREVFSNVGVVADLSTLTRFMTAKDDNNQKQLAWGVITDAKGVMRIHLRDFRPHVSSLLSIGRKDLANLIAQDYLDAYADGLNRYVRELSRITTASRETINRQRTKGLLKS
jgi:hypothetical protein